MPVTRIRNKHTDMTRQHQPEPSRRQILAGTAGAAIIIAGATAAKAQETTGTSVDFLFVQTVKGMAFAADPKRLTLRGVSPFTLFFGDRPERIAGMTTTDFVPFGREGRNGVLSDPSNADLSIAGVRRGTFCRAALYR